MGDISSLVLRVDSSGVGKASEDLDGFSKSAEKSASSATEFTDSVISINDGALKAAAGTTALTAATIKLISSLGSAAQSALQTYSHFEQMENGLVTVFQSAEKGKAVFEDLRAFSFKTTFGVDELADAATQLYNVGMAEDEVKQKLAMLGDLAGGQKQKFADLVSVYGKIVSTGQAGSMQLQQLALRGVPIKQVLHDMGVEGVASAEQITEAFERLTGEGGRFHDAMNSIIDTIEGKEGFLSDTLKEMGVNFAEASGLADAYKDALDVVYGGVQALTDKLADIGDDPFSKALFQGTLAAIIGGVGVSITAALVPALGAVAAKMGIIAALTAIANPAVLIGGAVVGVGMFALSKEVEHAKELTKEIDGLVEKRNELQKLQDDGTATFEEQIELQRTQVALAEEMVRRREEEQYLYGGDDYYSAEAKEALDVEKQKLAAMLEQKRVMDEALWIYKVMESQAQKVKAIEAERIKEQNDLLENNRKIYEQTYEGRKEWLQSQIEKEKNFINRPVINTGETKTGYVAGVKYESPIFRDATDKEIAEAKASLKEYEKQLKELDKKRYIELHPKIKEPEKSEFERAVEEAQKNLDNVRINFNLGFDSSGDLGEAEANLIRAKLRKAYDDAGLTKMEAGTPEYEEQLAKLKEINAEDFKRLDAIQRQTDAYGYMSDKLTEIFEKSGLTRESSEILAASLTNVVSTQIPNTLVSGFEAIGAALAEGASAGDAMREVTLNFVKTLLSNLSAACIQAGVMLIAQSGWAGVPGALALFALGGVAGIGAGALGSSSSAGSEYEQKEKEQLELLRALNEQYKSLYDAMKEQEEYYLQKRRQIDSTGINEASGLTQVNDMILTPQGNFSTSPKDYLIATKNPSGLFNGSGDTKISVVINNSMADSANVTARSGVSHEGQQELVVSISKRIAQDYATGMNGWDNAIDANSARRRGRSLA